MANTTNFNWETPDDTDLVKDGAAAIRTLGSAIDTSLVDLKGGTTDQVLAKNSNTDMDFKWVTSDDANAIQNAIVDAKGDIIAASAADTPARLAVGTDNQRLVAASGETAGLKYVSDTQNTVVDAEGDLLVGDAADTLQRLAIGSNAQVLTVDTSVDGKIKWATPAGGGGKVLQVVQGTYATTTSVASTTMTDTGLSLSITPTLATSKILVLVNQLWQVDRASIEMGHAMRIMRGSTEIYTTGQTASAGYVNASGATNVGAAGVISLGYLDSPSTTSSTTYKTQGRVQTTANSGTATYQPNSGTSTITLLEIGV
jgi:hypothetical protein